MAWANKYRFRFDSIHGVEYNIYIQKDGYTGSVIQRKLGRAPVLRKRQNGPICGTSLGLYAECAVDGEFAELYTSNPKEYKVNVQRNGVLIWTGFVSTELYSEPSIAPPYDVQIVATDGLGELKLNKYEARGEVSLRALLVYLLGFTGSDRSFYIASNLRRTGGTRQQTLSWTINVDYLDGKSCYEVLTQLLDSLHATITTYGDRWLIARETDIANLVNSSGTISVITVSPTGTVSTANLTGIRRTVGKMGVAEMFPNGNLSTAIEPARNSVVVKAPWRLVDAFEGADLSDATVATMWSHDDKQVRASILDPWQDATHWASGRYYVGDALTGNEGYICHPLSMTNINGASFSLHVKATAEQVNNTNIWRLLRSTLLVYLSYTDETGTLYWSEDKGWSEHLTTEFPDIGTPVSYNKTEIELSVPPVTIRETGSGQLKFYVAGKNFSVTYANIVVSRPEAGYQDTIHIGNGARGASDEVELIASRVLADNISNPAFYQGVWKYDGSLLTSFADTVRSGLDFMSIMALDRAASVALARTRTEGIVDVPDNIARIPLVIRQGNQDSWVETWEWDLHKEDVRISALSLPNAAITVESEVVEPMTSGGSSSSRSHSGGSSSSSSSSSGTSLLSVWQSLANDGSLTDYDENTKISASHLPDLNFFEEDGNGGIKLKDQYNGLWASGFITAGGIGSGGSGGGGIDIDRVWESLTNNTDKPNVLINQAHIPIVPQSKVDGLAATLASIYTKSETDAQIAAAIAALPSPMIFQGSLGTDGTITTLPAASSSNEGWTYKVITAGTYQGIAAKIGDTFISNGTAWIHIPSGDEPNGTVTSVGLSVPTGLSVSGSPITTSGTLKITFASGYSIPTNAKQNAWTAKYDKPSTGIPLSDLASGVQTSLGLADAALQSHQTIYSLVVKNSAGTTQLTYTPNSEAGSITLTKAMVGLSNVENTKLSTWAGTNKITTLGTITNGVWHGTAIANDYLANSSITIGSKSISLGGSATLTQIGVPAWAQASALAFGSLPKMYIAKNEVQSSSAMQDLTGLGNLEPDTNKEKNLGSSSKRWWWIYGSAASINEIWNLTEIYARGYDNEDLMVFTTDGGYNVYFGNGMDENGGEGYHTNIRGSDINFLAQETGDEEKTIAMVDYYGLHPASNNAYDLGYTTQRWRNICGVNGNFSGTMNVSGATSLSSGLTVSGNSSLHGNVTIGAGTTYPAFTLSANSQQGLKITGEDATGSNDYLIFKLGKLGVHTTPTSSSSTVDINGTAFVSGLARFDAGVKLVTTKKIWFGDTYYIELDSNNYLHTNAPFYSDGFITAGGIGTSGGSGGGGLIETLHRYADLGGSFSDSANDTFNAYTINKINTDLAARITALEGGSATSIETTGSGNVVSSVTKSGTTITVTKGITALTSHQSLDGYVNEIETTGEGRNKYISDVTKSGSTLTFTYATLPTTIALSNVTGADDLKAIEALPGTSGLLKKTNANTWTLDTTSYATAASLDDYLPLSGGQMTGAITFLAGNSKTVGLQLTIAGGSVTNNMDIGWDWATGAGSGIALRSSTATGGAGAGGFDIYARSSTATANTKHLRGTAAGALSWDGSFTATSIKKSGGTASQFLKADGSVDSNTYLTTGVAASTYVTALGVDGEDLTWTKNNTVNHITVPFAETVRDMKVEEMDDQVFTSRQTADGALTWNPSSALARRIKGNTIVWNQLNDETYVPSSGIVSVSQSGTAVTITSTTNASNVKGARLKNASCIAGHKYYLATSIDATNLTKSSAFFHARLSSNGSEFSASVAFGEKKRASVIGTVTSALDFYLRLGNTVPSGEYAIFTNNILIDLTLMFGSGKEPTTVEEFEEMFPLDYYDYNAGTLLSNAATGIETVGRNLIDINTLPALTGKGTIDSDGAWYLTSGNASVNVKVWENTLNYTGQLYVQFESKYSASSGSTGQRLRIIYTDGTYDDVVPTIGTTYTTALKLSNANKVVSHVATNYGTAGVASWIKNLIINFSDPNLNGTYEPYWKRSLPLKLNTLKGKLNGTGESVVVFPDGLRSAGTVYDEIVGNKATKRFGEVDLGTLTWAVASNGILYAGLNSAAREKQTTGITVVCSKYLAAENRSNTTEVKSNPDKSVCLLSTVGSTHRVYVYDSSYTDAAAFKTAMSGVMLYYELATPEEYILDEAIPTMMRVDRLGTESVYPANGEVPYTAPMRMDVQYGTRTGDIAGSIAEVRDSYLPLSGGALTGELSLTGSSKKLWFGDTYYIELVNIGTTANPQYALHTNAPLYSDGFITAGGVNANA